MTTQAEDGRPDAPTGPAPSVTRIVLTFGPAGSADCDVDLGTVTLGQLTAAAWLLDAFARDVHTAQQIARARQRGLVVAPGLAGMAAVAEGARHGR